MVSHDRNFLDNVVTSILVFEEDGILQEYVGGYKDWARRGKHLLEMDSPTEVSSDANNVQIEGEIKKPKKLSYKLQRELDELPVKIEELEKYLEQLTEETGDPQFYDQPFEKTKEVLDQLSEAQEELSHTMKRWAELEGML